MLPSGETETPEGVLKIPAPPVPLNVETTRVSADADWIEKNSEGAKTIADKADIASFRDLFIPIILGFGTFNVYAELGHVHDICAKTLIAQFLTCHWLIPSE